MIRNNLTTVFMGDSTWVELFPKRFKREYPSPSFNIYDLDTVDTNIRRILPKELEKSDWDVLIAHFLGVDHCGHKHGPNHPEMTRKLNEMDEVIRFVIEKMEDNTTLIVIGDHGMTHSGDHGGDSEEELNALFFMYSKDRPLVAEEYQHNYNERTMQQIDLVPTISTILGIPIPYSNLGTIQLNLMPDVEFSGLSKYQLLLIHGWQNAKQMSKYFTEYSQSNENTFNSDFLDDFGQKFKLLSDRVNLIHTEIAFKNFMKDTQGHLKVILETCRDIWVKFDPILMSRGLMLVCLFIFSFFLLINYLTVAQLSQMYNPKLLKFVFGTNFSFISSYFILNHYSHESIIHFDEFIFYICVYNFLVQIFLILQNWSDISDGMMNDKKTLSDFFVRFIYVMFISVFFSNSFIVQEQKIQNYLLCGLVLLSIYELYITSSHFEFDKKKVLKIGKFFTSFTAKFILLAVVSIVLIRMTYMQFKCREEQTNCNFLNAAPTPSPMTKRPRGRPITLVDLLPIIILALYTSVTKMYFRSIGNLSGNFMNILYFRYCPIISTVCASGHFILSKNSFVGINSLHVDCLAWIVYGVFVLQLLILAIDPLMIHLIPTNQTNPIQIFGNNIVPEIFRRMKSGLINSRSGLTSGGNGEGNIPIVCGLGTVYSSVFVSFGFVLSIQLGLLLGLNPTVGLYLIITVGIIILIVGGALRYQSTKNFEVCLQPRFITLVSWIVITHYTFYATSHQPTMSQIDWHAAFVGRVTNHDHNVIISGVLVILNTFGGVFLFISVYPMLNIIPLLIPIVIPSLADKKKKDDKLQLTADNLEYRTVNINKSESFENYDFDTSQGELNLYQKDKVFMGSVFKTGCQLLLLQSLRVFCSMLACTIHCRHLMVWKIFAPRFIYEGMSTYVFILSLIFGYCLLIRVHKAVDMFITFINKTS